MNAQLGGYVRPGISAVGRAVIAPVPLGADQPGIAVADSKSRIVQEVHPEISPRSVSNRHQKGRAHKSVQVVYRKYYL